MQGRDLTSYPHQRTCTHLLRHGAAKPMSGVLDVCHELLERHGMERGTNKKTKNGESNALVVARCPADQGDGRPVDHLFSPSVDCKRVAVTPDRTHGVCSAEEVFSPSCRLLQMSQLVSSRAHQCSIAPSPLTPMRVPLEFGRRSSNSDPHRHAGCRVRQEKVGAKEDNHCSCSVSPTSPQPTKPNPTNHTNTMFSQQVSQRRN